MNIDTLNGKEFGSRTAIGTNKSASIIETVTENIMSHYNFLTIEETKEIWYYERGVYVSGGEVIIEKEAERICGYQLANRFLMEIKGHIMRKTYHKQKEIDADIDIVNLKNGFYDIDKGTIHSHTPAYLSINQKNIYYKSGAKPRLFGKFLKEVLYSRDIRTAVEAMAYTFHRDFIVEVIFMLHGFGANGKTVYTSVITGLHGAANISNVTLSEMLGDRFALSDLEAKDVNIDNELSGQTIKETAILKKLTGGSRQYIRVQRKNQKAYDTILYAKLFFNANRIPDAQDISDAYNRRVIIIAFPNRFDGQNEDKQLISKLIQPDELSGIFNVLMIALRRIRKNKELYVNEKTIEEKRVKYERTVNPVKTFIDEVVIEESTESSYLPKTNFHTAFIKYCNKYGLPPLRYDIFCKILKNDFNYLDSKPTINGKRVTCWKGIVLKTEYWPKIEQSRLEEMI